MLLEEILTAAKDGRLCRPHRDTDFRKLGYWTPLIDTWVFGDDWELEPEPEVIRLSIITTATREDGGWTLYDKESDQKFPLLDVELAALYAAILTANGMEPLTVDAIAEEIRRVDGNNSLGAGLLAEKLHSFIKTCSLPASKGEPEYVPPVTDDFPEPRIYHVGYADGHRAGWNASKQLIGGAK